ncbi:MAG: hypothetical protein AB1457_12235 [Chloroflexota bacterium]
MIYPELVRVIADILKEFDSEEPVHKSFHPGIGPFGEPQLVKEIAKRLSGKGIRAYTKRTPDLVVCDGPITFGIEFKIVRPFGDNGREAENWSVNMLHPYPGNVSLLADALKLINLNANISYKGLFLIGYEHNPAEISLDPLIQSFEFIARQVMKIPLGLRVEERRDGLIHPVHQVLRCVGWKLD